MWPFTKKALPPPPEPMPMPQHSAAAHFILTHMNHDQEIGSVLLRQRPQAVTLEIKRIGTAFAELTYDGNHTTWYFKEWLAYDPHHNKRPKGASRALPLASTEFSFKASPMEEARRAFLFQDGQGNFHEAHPTSLVYRAGQSDFDSYSINLGPPLPGPHSPKPAQIVPFSDDIQNLPVLKRHTLRALVGILADRHDRCRSPHHFCGEIQGREGMVQFVAESALQKSPDGDWVIGIYLTPARSGMSVEETRACQVPFEYVANLMTAEDKPSRKLVVQPLSDGTYTATYGEIVNPTVGDYSTGALNWDGDVRKFRCNPEPEHAGWHYFDSPLDDNQLVVPRYLCAMVGQHWLIADVDVQNGVAEVAHLELTSWPEHNYGIYKPEAQNCTYIVSQSGSEWSRVVDENLERSMP